MFAAGWDERYAFHSEGTCNIRKKDGMGDHVSKALFLDRDGVVNEDVGYVYRPEDFRFTEGIFEFCLTAQDLGYLLIIVTNQAGIARGYYTEEDYHKLNEWMLVEFKKEGVRIEAVYFCPYHPIDGIGAYKCESYDRKPNPGMIFKARDKFGIQLSKSILVGDKESDIEAGRRAGVGKLLLLKGKYPFTPSADIDVYDSIVDIGTKPF